MAERRRPAPETTTAQTDAINQPRGLAPRTCPECRCVFTPGVNAYDRVVCYERDCMLARRKRHARARYVPAAERKQRAGA